MREKSYYSISISAPQEKFKGDIQQLQTSSCHLGILFLILLSIFLSGIGLCAWDTHMTLVQLGCSLVLALALAQDQLVQPKLAKAVFKCH